jgi:peptidoglycan/xylan/chitin deacetylase (PgdA/CDA1 family)
MIMEQPKSIAKAFGYYCGYYHLVDRIRRIKDKQGRLLILTYHNLLDEAKSGDSQGKLFQLRPSVTKRQFESHLRVLKKGFRVVSLPEIVGRIRDKGQLEEDYVVITFDDGYESFYRVGFPLLRKYDFPATVFLPTDFVNNLRMFWWDELLQIIFNAVSPHKSTSALISIMGKKLSKQFCAAGNVVRHQKKFLESLEAYLRNMEDGKREEKIENLKEIIVAHQDVKSPSLKILSWDQIAEMSQNGVSFESHTCSHLNLKFASLQKVEEELSRSKQIIEKNISRKVVCFAYPYEGDFETHLRVKPILQNLKYECACTCLTGVNQSSFDPFSLSRITLPMTTFSPVIARELLLGYSGKFKKASIYATS